MIIIKLSQIRLPALLIICWLAASLPVEPASASATAGFASVIGTWKGESICVGNHPACKNEIAVYRFEAVAGKSDVVVLFGDKIIEGKRVPMGKLEFQFNEVKGELSCDFTINQTHGLWQFKVSGDQMEGTLVTLPSRDLVRRVNVKRVAESEVPAAPAKSEYEEL
jgi:hypothetical protein